MDPTAAILMFVSDAERHGIEATLRTTERLTRAALPGRVIVQLRDRGLGDGERFALGRALRELTRDASQWLSINQRLDLACLLDADALHLPAEGPSPQRVVAYLRTCRRRPFLTMAGHDPERAPAGVDGWVLSPVVEARKGRPALGVETLRAAVEAHPALPIFALGGIDAANARLCRQAGARVAVVGAAYAAPDELLDALGILRRPAD